VNPHGEDRRWDKYKVVSDVQSEIAVLRDVDGDGKPEVVYMGDGQVRYAKPDPANPTGAWTIHNVSEKGYATAHGIGVGDINGDNREHQWDRFVAYPHVGIDNLGCEFGRVSDNSVPTAGTV
jgi:FG-GAP-like repeat